MNTSAFSLRRGLIILAAWLGATVALAPLALKAEKELDVTPRIPGSQSGLVEEKLRKDFQSPFAHYVLLVAEGLPAPSEKQGDEVFRWLAKVVQGVPGVSGIQSYLDFPDTLFLGAPSGGKRKGSWMRVGLDPAAGKVDDLIPKVRAACAAMEDSLRSIFPQVELRLTGEAALNHDLRQISTEQVQKAEKIALPLTFLLLVLAFRSLGAVWLPLLAGIISTIVSLGLGVALSRFWPVSILLQNVASMLGLALGVDYSLLAVFRFREALAQGLSAHAAAQEVRRHAGRTVALSGAAVAIGFGALCFLPLSELQAVAIGGLLVVACSIGITCTLIPVLLGWLGHRIHWGGMQPKKNTGTDRWYRWGLWVSAHPKKILFTAGLPVLLLAAQAARIQLRIPASHWMPGHIESAEGIAGLERMGRAGLAQTLRVILEMPEGMKMDSPEGVAAMSRVSSALASDARISRISNFPFISKNGRETYLEILPREGVASGDIEKLVREIRTRGADSLVGLSGSHLLIGGWPAFNADYEDAVKGRFWMLFALVAGGTWLGLFVMFRSFLIPLKAVVLNLLSVAAAFGGVVLVFQEGIGGALMGVPGGTGSLFPIIPPLVFCTVFGLSMDYEIFLVARVAEARKNGADAVESLAQGLSGTGKVITGAAAVMIAVFAAFTLGDFLLIRILGFALALAVFLDATFIRLAIGPALLQLAGKWNWWPGPLYRNNDRNKENPKEVER